MILPLFLSSFYLIFILKERSVHKLFPSLKHFELKPQVVAVAQELEDSARKQVKEIQYLKLTQKLMSSTQTILLLGIQISTIH